MSLKLLNKSLVLAAVLMLVFGCKPKVNDISSYVDLDTYGWRYTDEKKFEFEQPDTIAKGRYELWVRHTNDFPYRNLWLEVSINDSLTSRIDTLNIALSDLYGNWQGRGIGTDFQLTHIIRDSVKIYPPVDVKIRHIMRVDTLTGIEQVGINFIEYPQKEK